MPEFEENTSADQLGFLAAAAAVPNLPVMTRKAVASLTSYLRSSGASLTSDPAEALTGWIISLFLNGISLNTAIAYLDAVSGIHTRSRSCSEESAVPVFRILRCRLRSEGRELWTEGVSSDALARMRNFIRTAAEPNAPVASSIILFSILNAAMPPTGVVRLSVAETEEMDISSDAREIAHRCASPTRKYVFPFQQSRRTPRQLDACVNSAVAARLAACGVPLFGDPAATLSSYWCAAALDAGVPAGMILSILGTVPAGMKILSLAAPIPVEADDRVYIAETVGRTFADNPLHWYAMRLRPRATFADVRDRITALAVKPDLFYPCDEIARRVGKKIVYEERPVIRDIVFFRSRITDIRPLFTIIGDLAWCYRTSAIAGAPPAVIPNSSLRLFQETIGHFSPSDLTATDTSRLIPGTSVIITGGKYIGLRATILKTAAEAAESADAMLQIENPLGINWIARIDLRLLRTIA